MAAIDRLDEVKREVSHAARELFVAADMKAWNMPLARAITTRRVTAVKKGRHGVLPQLWKTAEKLPRNTCRLTLHTNAALSRDHQDCPRRSPIETPR